MEIEIFKVCAKSDGTKLASAISHRIKAGEAVQLNAIGAGAVNQAIKSIAIARGFLAPLGIEIACSPSFNLIDVEGHDKTVIMLLVKRGTT